MNFFIDDRTKDGYQDCVTEIDSVSSCYVLWKIVEKEIEKNLHRQMRAAFVKPGYTCLGPNS